MQPTAVRMADKLRILVPIKRVIDYAVCSAPSTKAGRVE